MGLIVIIVTADGNLDPTRGDLDGRGDNAPSANLRRYR